jgi:pimeloyl-ACP methyl ester carboxylesterase
MSLTPAVAAALAGAALLLPVPLAAQPAAWRLAQPEAPVAETAVRETRWQLARPPGAPADRIQLHRYRGSEPRRAVLLFLPGTNMNGQVAVPDPDHNLWLFLARRGVEVFTLDYRTHFLPAGAPADLRAVRGWTLETFVEDIRAAAGKAREESGEPRVFVAGFSRGVGLAYAYACVEPEAVAGLVALDGAFKNHAPKGRYDRAAEARKLEGAGTWARDVSGRMGWEARLKLMAAAAEAPDGPALDPRYATAGAQVADVLYNAWQPGALANPVEGLSKPQVLARLLAGYDRYYPAVQDVDGRAIADREDDPATPLDDLWGEMKAPILYFGATGMGTEWLLDGIHSAGASGSKDVTVNVLERYGHLDVLVGEYARRDVYEPVLAWMLRRAGPAAAARP